MAIKDDALERQRRRLLIGIQQKQQSPGAMAGDAFAAAVYGDHPYAHPTEGNEKTIAALSRTDVAAFHARHYVARNAMIVIVGDLTRTRARTLAAELTRAMKKGEPVSPLPAVPPLAGARDIHIVHPSSQMHVLTGQPGITRTDPDYFALYVGNQVLGGGGLVSRLFEEIRDKRGLSYSAYSYFSPREQAGPFVAGLQTRADQAPEALAVLREELRRYVNDGPTTEELTAVKSNITGGFPLRIDANGKILGYVAVIGFYGLPLDYLDTFIGKVNAVTVADVRNAFSRRVDPDRLVTVQVGPDPAAPDGEAN